MCTNRQSREKFLAFISVAISLSFHKLGALVYIEKTHKKILDLLSISFHAASFLAIRYSSASTAAT